MNTRTWREVPDSRKSVHALARALALVVTCGMLCSALSLAAQEKPDKDSASGKGSQGAGIYFDAEASAKDVGLPIYPGARPHRDRKSTRLNSSHDQISYAVFCLKKKKMINK